MFDKLKYVFKNLAMNWAVGLLTAENVKSILLQLIAKLKEKTDATENPIDDAAVDALEFLVSDEKRVEILVEWLKAKLNTDRICQCPNGEELDCDVTDLGAKIICTPDGICEGSTTLTIIVSLLQTILPILIDLWQKKQDETDTEVEE